MGTEVKAFPGPAEVMNRWKERLPPMDDEFARQSYAHNRGH